MVVSAYVFATRGGRILAEIEPAAVSWSWEGNPAETVDVTIDMNNPVEADRNWRNLGSPWAHSLAIEIGDPGVGARYLGGPILPHDFDDDGATLKVTARGIRFALAHRNVLPVAALTTSLVDSAGVPRPSMNSVWSGLDYGTIGKRLTQQAFAWPGWTDIPITYHADRPGTRLQTYEALDFMDVDEALSNLSGLENGPDIRFELKRTGDTFGWVYRSGTDAAPRLTGDAVYAWEVGKASGLKVQTNPSLMASVAWSLGGRNQDQVLVDMLYDPAIVDSGGVLLERRSDASDSTARQETLRSWNVETLRTGRRPWEFSTLR